MKITGSGFGGHTRIGLLALLLVAIACPPAVAGNSFLVAPGRIDLDISRPVTQSFIITNNGDGPIRIVIKPVYYEIDARALAAGHPINPDVDVQDDLTGFMRLSPRALNLKPGQRRDVRVSIRPPANMPDGDYRAHLLVKMLTPIGNIESKLDAEGAPDGIQMQIKINLETAAAIYGHRGKRDPNQVSFSCTRAEDGQLLLDARNPSKWRVEGVVQGYPHKEPKEGEKVAAVPTMEGEPLFETNFNVYRESHRTLRTRWTPPDSGALDLMWRPTNAEGEPRHTVCQPK